MKFTHKEIEESLFRAWGEIWELELRVSVIESLIAYLWIQKHRLAFDNFNSLKEVMRNTIKRKMLKEIKEELISILKSKEGR